MRIQPWKAIPNFITLLNLLSGCLGILATFYGQVHLAGYLIVLAAVFDFFDGFTARLLNAYSAIGKELDSLADLISFGLLPSVIVFHLMRESLGLPMTLVPQEPLDLFLLAAPFSLVAFSALRLAKFNIDERQTTDFIGLPTPASALCIAALAVVRISQPDSFLIPLIASPWSLILLVTFLSALMVSELPMFSLKLKNLRPKENLHRLVFLSIALILLICLHQSSIPLIIGVYILESGILHIFWNKKPDLQ